VVVIAHCHWCRRPCLPIRTDLGFGRYGPFSSPRVRSRPTEGTRLVRRRPARGRAGRDNAARRGGAARAARAGPGLRRRRHRSPTTARQPPGLASRQPHARGRPRLAAGARPLQAKRRLRRVLRKLTGELVVGAGSLASPQPRAPPIPPRFGQTTVAARAASRTLSTSSGRRWSHQRQPDPSDDRTADGRGAPALGATGERRALGSRPAQACEAVSSGHLLGPHATASYPGGQTRTGSWDCARRIGRRELRAVAMSPVRPAVRVIGRRFEVADHRLRDFLTRAAQPHEWIEAGGSPARTDGARRAAAASRPGRRPGVCRSHG
jgi:hypothetical protein